LQDLAIGLENDVRRVKNAAPLFPESADALCIVWRSKTVPNRKRHALSFDGFLSLLQGIDGHCHNANAFRFELFKVALIVGQLPKTIGSPPSTIDQEDIVILVQSIGNAQGSPINHRNVVGREVFSRV
jgi:hypothetical protein